MRAVILAFAMSGWLLAAVHAASPPTMCFDTDSNAAFPVSEGLPENELLGGKMPSVDYDADHHPTGLTWVELPPGIVTRAEPTGSYRGNTIYRCTYRWQDQTAEDRSPFDLVVFGYLVPSGKQRSVRPFCIVTGDPGIGTFNDRFTASLREPFALKISETLRGTGGICEDYTFVFDSREARLRERSESGRHSPLKTYTYDRAGKIISTKTAKQD